MSSPTPERLADLEQLDDPIVKELLTALRETRNELRVALGNNETAVLEWARVEDERDALQRRVEALRVALNDIATAEGDDYLEHKGCLQCEIARLQELRRIAKDALRGEGAG